MLVDLSPTLLAQAMNLADKHALRGSDAFQLAAAIEVHTDCLVTGMPLTVVSADVELNAANSGQDMVYEAHLEEVPDAAVQVDMAALPAWLRRI